MDLADHRAAQHERVFRRQPGIAADIHQRLPAGENRGLFHETLVFAVIEPAPFFPGLLGGVAPDGRFDDDRFAQPLKRAIRLLSEGGENVAVKRGGNCSQGTIQLHGTSSASGLFLYTNYSTPGPTIVGELFVPFARAAAVVRRAGGTRNYTLETQCN